MKKIFALITIAAVTFGCGGDGNEDPNSNPNPNDVYLTLSGTDIVFDESGGDKNFTISSNSSWTITENASWLTPEKTNGDGNNQVKLTAIANDSHDDRNTVITIKAGTKTETFTVTQKQQNALIVTKDKFDILQSGGSFTIEVKSNIDYTISVADNCKSWITEKPQTRALSSKSYTFEVSENPNTTNREGNITIKGENGTSETVTVYQAQRDELIFTQSEYTIPAKGETITVELRTNVAYEVLIPTNAQSWVKQLTSEREDRLIFEISPNGKTEERREKIIIKDKNSNLSGTLTIIQVAMGSTIGDIILSSDVELIEFKGAGYETVKGNLIITGADLLTLSKLDNLLKEVNGNLIINATNLTSLDGLYGLVKVSGDLIISATKNVDFEGLNNLGIISGNFSVRNARSLKTFDGLSKLKTIDGNFEIYGTSSLVSFEGLESLENIVGTFKLPPLNASNYEFKYLKSFKGLNNLKTIGGNIEITCPAPVLESFEGLESLSEIKGSFIVASGNNLNYNYSDLKALKSFKGLNSLKTIGGDFEINSSPYGNNNTAYSLQSLESFEGLEKLESIGGDFKIISFSKVYFYSYSAYAYSLNALKSFKGLNNLKTIGGDFIVSSKSEGNGEPFSMNSLTSFDGLESLNNIAGDFKILVSAPAYSGGSSSYYEFSLCKLQSFDGLGSLKIIGGDFEINISNGYSRNSLKSFISFKGLENLEKIVGDFKIFAVNGFYVLESFEGLNNLKIIEKTFNIENITKIISFDALDNLTTIKGGVLYINKCGNLSDLSALSGVTSIIKDISITGCPKLYDFTPLVPMVEKMTGTWYVTSCGYNPTKYQMLNGQSKPTE